MLGSSPGRRVGVALTGVLSCAVVAAADDVADRIAFGNKALSYGAYAQAAKAFERADRKSGGSCAPCRLGMAQARFMMGEPQKARELAEWVVAKAADAHQRSQARVLTGMTWSRSRASEDWPKAETAYREALSIEPKNGTALYRLAEIQFRQGSKDAGLATLASLVDVDPTNPLAGHARRILEHPQIAGLPLVPEFRLTTKAGDVLTPQALEGKIVLMDFWATWCGPCRKSVAEIREVAQKFGEKGLVVVSVSVDRNKRAWEKFISEQNMTWPQVLDDDDSVERVFGVNLLPTYWLVDPHGAIRARLVDYDPHATLKSRLQAEIEKILGSQ